ncbi:hypothetical protein [Anaerocolumna jejuensis]|uniref:hypothetical protein n=1 Tax=Anaerocolumna jejuensis TaxID=259063 RepID=UPI003F7BAE04
MAIGVAIGYEDLEKRIKKQMELITKEYNIICTDKAGDEIPFDNIIKEIFKKRRKY